MVVDSAFVRGVYSLIGDSSRGHGQQPMPAVFFRQAARKKVLEVKLHTLLNGGRPEMRERLAKFENVSPKSADGERAFRHAATG